MATWIINPDGYYPYCSKCGYEPEVPRIHADNRTPFCPQCGERMKKEFEEKTQGKCKICEYMHEERYEYDDQTILIPHCYGQKNAPKVLYTDTCKDFQKKEEK